jgi:hypothetical protein
MRTSRAIAALALVGVACVSAPFTSGGTADAGSDGEVDAGPTFCTGQTGALFCADFDAKKEPFGFDRVVTTRTASLVAAGDSYVSPARALLATGPAPSKAAATVNLEGHLQDVTLKLALNIDTLSERLRDQGGIRVAALSFATGSDLYAAGFLLENDKLTLVESPGNRTSSVPVTIVTGAWLDVEIAGAMPTVGSTSAPLKVTVRNGDQVFSKDLAWSPPALHTSVGLEVGGFCDQVPLAPETWALRYDNVVLTGTRVP